MPTVTEPTVKVRGPGQMPDVLEAISRALPLSYAISAMQSLTVSADVAEAAGAVGAIVAFIAGALVLGTATLRRRTA